MGDAILLSDDGARPVAIFIWGLNGGAFSNLATALAEGFMQAGRGPVDLLVLNCTSSTAVRLPEGVRLVPLGVTRSASAPHALVGYLRRRRPRVLLTMPTIVTVPALLGYRLAGRRVRSGTSFIVYQGDTLGNDIAIEHLDSWRMRVLPHVARLAYRWADALTTCAPGVLDLMKRDAIPLPARTAVIPNPVDVDQYQHRATEPASHPWLVNKSGPVITTLARLAKRKNHTLLLRALRRVIDSGVDARLIIIGEGPERERTQLRAAELGLSDAVALPGFLPNPHADIARSDLFVMSSIDEAFCLALVEAMACGVAVVSTDAVGGGPRFILTGGGEAPPPPAVLQQALTPNDDDRTLAETIGRVLTDDSLRSSLADAGLTRAQHFRPETVGHTWAQFFDRLTNEASVHDRTSDIHESFEARP
jgi:glycosyltransferase involved in cell wall biosynthesis